MIVWDRNLVRLRVENCRSSGNGIGRMLVIVVSKLDVTITMEEQKNQHLTKNHENID